MQKLSYVRLFLLTVSVFSAGFAHASGGLFEGTSSLGVGEATFSLAPATGTYRSQEEFALELRLDTGKVSATSIKTYLTFDPKLLNVVKIETGKEFPYWWESKVEGGLVKLSASVSAPGVSGQISVAKIIFKGIRPGEAIVSYDANSIVLDAADKDILNLVSSAKGNFALVTGTELAPESDVELQDDSRNFLGLLLGVLGVLLAGVLLFIVWKKLQKKDQTP